MESIRGKKGVSLSFSDDEAIVLLEWLTKFNKHDHPSLFQDQSEQRVLFDLEAELEKVISGTFEGEYKSILLKAQERLRDVV